MYIRLLELRQFLSEKAVSVNSLDTSIHLCETGNDQQHYFYLVDVEGLPDIEDSLIGGISISNYNGPWGVDSISSYDGYGPLLYRIAMEWVSENSQGRGLTRNRGGETSDSAKNVWKKFDLISNDPSSKIRISGKDSHGYDEFISSTGELKKMRTRLVKLSKDQLDIAWNMLTDLAIGS